MTGLHPIVDLNRMELLELEDSRRPAGRPEVMGEYLPRLMPMPLREVSPLQVSQPDGISFRLEGRLLRWQNWELRLGFTAREGLVLHTVGFRTAAGCGRWPTGCRSRRWSCRTGTRPRTTTGGPRSTSASGAWAS